MIKSYRNLEVWKKSVDLTVEIHGLTLKFPPQERYSLSVQLQRAAVSVAANIAEGRSRLSKGDFRRGVSIARGSLAELETQIEIAKRLGYLPETSFETISKQVDSVGQMLSGLLRRLMTPRPESRGPSP